MKKMILILFTATSLFACSSECEKTTTNENEQAMTSDNVDEEKLADHVCTASCKPGACVMTHGEKGHVCTEECKTAPTDETTALKDHVCTADCKSGACVMAHGEKGHVCTDKCY